MMTNPTADILKSLIDPKDGAKWFGMYGGASLMYAKPTKLLDGSETVMLHSADGMAVFAAPDFEVAEVVARQNDMEMVRVQ